MNINNKLPKVSIVVNSFKDLNKLKLCLSSILKTKYSNKEIIVVTYGIDRQKINQESILSEIDKLIILDKDFGLPAQRNIGFKYIDKESKYVLFIDDDVLLCEFTISNLVKILEKYNNIGIAQPLLLTPDGCIDSIGAFVDFVGYSYMPLRGKKISHMDDLNKFEYIVVSYTSGACMMLRVNYFDHHSKFQPFDDEFYFNYEDADLCLRSWLRGIMVVCVPSAVAIHKRGRTSLLKRSPPSLIYLNTRNKFITLFSIHKTNKLAVFIMFFTIFELIKSIYLIKINIAHSLATLKAILWCFKNLRKIWQRRVYVQRQKSGIRVSPTKMMRPDLRTLLFQFKLHYELV